MKKNTLDTPASPAYFGLFSFSALLLTTLLALPMYFAANVPADTPLLRDPDLWWHLRNAEQLVIGHQFIHTDPYSFTVHGRPWINPEWLSEVPYYLGFRWMGQRGILFVMLAAMEAVLLASFFLCYLRSRNFMAGFLATWVMMLVGSINFGPRTLLFGWLCLALELILLERFEQGHDRLWLLPPLFALWVNLHGSWMIGLVFFTMFAAAGTVQGSWGLLAATRWSAAQRRKLVKIGLASFAALFLNPYGWRLAVYPFDLALRQKLNVSHGEEWQSLNFHGPNGKPVFLLLSALLLFTLTRSIKWPLYSVLFVMLAVYSGFTYSRFLFLIGITVCPLLAVVLAQMLPPEQRPQPARPILNAVLMAIILTVSVYRLPHAALLEQGRQRAFPQQAFARLSQMGPQARVFNAYGYGGYMIWSVPQVPTFVDSRTDIFEHYGVFADYLKAISLEDSLAILDKYGIQAVFFPKHDPLVYFLERTPGWKTEYDDGQAVILSRTP